MQKDKVENAGRDKRGSKSVIQGGGDNPQQTKESRNYRRLYNKQGCTSSFRAVPRDKVIN